MRLENKEPYRHRAVCLNKCGMFPGKEFLQSNEVPQRFTHLLSVDGDHVVMHPVLHGINTIGDTRLGNFRFMMREKKVHPAAVDIKPLAQVFCTHHRTFKVPAWESFAPGGGPAHNVL